MKIMVIFLLLSMMTPSVEAQDWANLKRYRADNAALEKPGPKDQRVVFMGNSITEQWFTLHAEFFKEHGFINRGIGGQTTPQMLVRFHADVLELKPKVVIILGGINDIAGNTGPSSLKMIEDNITDMATLAASRQIKVILCSLLPANKIPWARVDSTADKVMELNKWIKQFAKSNGYMYADYFTPMVDEHHGLPLKYSKDGIHPNIEGYEIMEPIILKKIKKALK